MRLNRLQLGSRSTIHEHLSFGCRLHCLHPFGVICTVLRQRSKGPGAVPGASGVKVSTHIGRGTRLHLPS